MPTHTQRIVIEATGEVWGSLDTSFRPLVLADVFDTRDKQRGWAVWMVVRTDAGHRLHTAYVERIDSEE